MPKSTPDPHRITIVLRRITDSTGYANMMPPHDGPAFRGTGNIDYICPKCRHILAQGLWRTSLGEGVAFTCPTCGTIGAVPPPLPPPLPTPHR